MDDNPGALVALSIITLCIIANAFFAAAEFALVRCEPAILRSPDYKRRRGSRSARILLKEFDYTLILVQLGITCSTLIYTLVGMLFLQAKMAALIAAYTPETQLFLVAAASIAIIAAIHIVVGELLSKSIAVRHPERVLLVLAPVLLGLSKLLRPLLFVLRGSTDGILSLFRFRFPTEIPRLQSASDLALIVSRSRESGVFDEDEEEMLQGVFGFSQTVAREVMTPRTDLVAIPIDASLEQLIESITESGFSRFPVRGQTVDDIKGILLLKDLLPILAQAEKERFSVANIMRKAYFIPDTKPIDDLLNEFKSRKLHMAIVLDEHGGVDGLVTLEDLIEEIVGDIFDESDTAEEVFEIKKNGDVICDGGLLVSGVE